MEFRDYIDKIGSVWAAVSAGGVIFPVVAALAGFAPSGTLISSELNLVLISGFFVILTCAHMWNILNDSSEKKCRIIFNISSILTVALLFIYFTIIWKFQFYYNDHIYIAGCQWTKEALLVIDEVRSECPGNFRKLLELGAEPSEIWEETSIQNIEMILYFMWILLSIFWVSMFCAMSSVVFFVRK
jgi:hypothetical protein